MGRPTRGEKELERILRLDNAQAYINRLIRAFKPFKEVERLTDKEHLQNFLEGVQKAYGRKGRNLPNTHISLGEAMERLEKFIKTEAENPIPSFPLSLYEKVLFGSLKKGHEFMGISHKICDEHEGYLHPHAILFIEPGAKIADAIQYLNLYGSEINAELKKYLPKGSHLKKAIRLDAYKMDRDKEIIKLRQEGMSYIKIQLHFRDKGEKINLDTLRAVVKNANKKARK